MTDQQMNDFKDYMADLMGQSESRLETKVESEVGSLRTEISTLRADFSILSADICALHTEVTVLRTEFGTLYVEFKTLRAEMYDGFTGIGDAIELLEERMYRIEKHLRHNARNYQ